MVYVGQTRSSRLIKRLESLGFGECTTPGELPPRRRPWFFDNGVFRDWKAGRPWGRTAWIAALESARSLRPDFIIAPDLVGEGQASLDHSANHSAHCEGFSTYLAVQDGMTERAVSKSIEGHGWDGLFVGGTLDWKIRTGADWVELAHRHGLRCHIGRVGTASRARWAMDIGADSIDSCLPLWSSGNLGVFVGALSKKQGVFQW